MFTPAVGFAFYLNANFASQTTMFKYEKGRKPDVKNIYAFTQNE